MTGLFQLVCRRPVGSQVGQYLFQTVLVVGKIRGIRTEPDIQEIMTAGVIFQRGLHTGRMVCSLQYQPFEHLQQDILFQGIGTGTGIEAGRFAFRGGIWERDGLIVQAPANPLSLRERSPCAYVPVGNTSQEFLGHSQQGIGTDISGAYKIKAPWRVRAFCRFLVVEQRFKGIQQDVP
ncbi:MAG TPA: hypothetical protein DDW70_02230 [Rikenellaceae bacterium]|nr:hypothetical protein [Rikenellaceae bacterium]